MRLIKKLGILSLSLAVVIASTSCGLLDDNINELKGSIKGNSYDVDFYSDYGEKIMTVRGSNIGIEGNYVDEVDCDGTVHKQLSSVVTFNVDGKEIENCGTTLVIKEKDLNPELDFMDIDNIESKSSGSISNWAAVSQPLNKWKNKFGKSRVVVIQTDLSKPICAFSGDNVYWKIPDDLPKTTKIMIDGKALYVHRAKFQIIDKALLKD